MEKSQDKLCVSRGSDQEDGLLPATEGVVKRRASKGKLTTPSVANPGKAKASRDPEQQLVASHAADWTQPRQKPCKGWPSRCESRPLLAIDAVLRRVLQATTSNTWAKQGRDTSLRPLRAPKAPDPNFAPRPQGRVATAAPPSTPSVSAAHRPPTGSATADCNDEMCVRR